MRLLVPVKGSIQNPSFAPDGKAFLFTRFRLHYNSEAGADLYIGDTRDRERCTLVTKGDLEGKTNVSQPGFRSCWHPNGKIIFSSDFGGNDWPHTIAPDGSGLQRLPGYDDGHAGYEPTFAPNGADFAFERHVKGKDDAGEIMLCMSDDKFKGMLVKASKDGADARQPSWSPDGRYIVWQERHGERWQLMLADCHSQEVRSITPADKDFTDATWHPDGDRVVCAGENALYEVTVTGSIAPLYAVEHPRTAYLGAPSWSPDGESRRRRLLCEASDRDEPEGGPGTWLEIF